MSASELVGAKPAIDEAKARAKRAAQRRATLMRQMVQWHWISAAVCLIGMLLFAITGITLNHAGAIEANPRTVEVEHRLPPGSVLPEGPILIALHELSVPTSGDYRRFLDHDGRRYAHTPDPRLGRPIDNGVRSVSVVHDACMDADALSTALGVLGPQAGPEFAAKHGLAAYFRVDDGAGLREILSPKLQAMLG